MAVCEYIRLTVLYMNIGRIPGSILTHRLKLIAERDFGGAGRRERGKAVSPETAQTWKKWSR